MLQKIRFMFITLPLLTFATQELQAWSIKGSAHNAYNNVTSLFERSKKDILSAEYTVQKNSIISLTNNDGSIEIKTWKKDAMMIEAKKIGKEKELPNTTFSVDTEGRDVTITTESLTQSAPLTINYTLIVPEDSSLIIKNDSGTIQIKDVQGDIDAQTLVGDIIVENGTNDVHARAPKGSITVEQNKLDHRSSIFLEAYRSVTLKISPKINANLNAKTLKGKITSDFYITLDPITTKLNNGSWKRIKQEIKGTIGSGGAPITIDVTKGNVILLEQ